MLSSAREQYVEQQKITAAAVLTSRRTRKRSMSAVLAGLTAAQLESAALTFGSTPAQLAEQGIEAPAEGRASLSAVVSGPDAANWLGKAKSDIAFDRIVAALVSDAGRTAATVDLLRRPRLTGYVRSLTLPSCSRCAVLAGRVYRYSTGFQRHPRCDCLMTPSTLETGRDLVFDERPALRSGQITGLSKGDVEAIDAGADLGQVVNVRRREAGLWVGSSVISRGDRLTPQGIAYLSSSRDEAISLLTRHGYITAA